MSKSIAEKNIIRTMAYLCNSRKQQCVSRTYNILSFIKADERAICKNIVCMVILDL